jgi:hypothetical protein
MPGKKLPALSLILLLITVLSLFVYHRSGDGNGVGWRSVINSDGRGYYAYLPSLFIYHDPTFDRCVAAERRSLKDPDYIPEYIVRTGSQTVNKYFIGVALLQMPFFICATAVAWAAGFPLTGYSLPFQVMAGLGAVFYLICGLWFLQRLLKRFVRKEWIIAFVTVAVTLGSNLLYYTIAAPLMSHVYSFFAITGILWAVAEAAAQPGSKWFLVAGIFFGLVVLIRPVNAIVILLIPVVMQGSDEQPSSIKVILTPPSLLMLLLPFLALLLLQSIAWHLQTGHWFVWSYGNEGFNFLHPAITEVLFGFRKGLFIYTPLTLIALPGFFYLYKWNRTSFFTSFIFLIFFIFLTASWWNWYYGDGFGMRPVIDVYVIFCILLAIAIDRSKPVVAGILFILITVCIFLNLFQSLQYSRGIIHPHNMDGQKYGYVFLRTGDRYPNSLGGSNEIPWYGTRTDKPCYQFRERNVYIDSLSKYNTGPNLGATLLPVIPGRYWLSGSFYVRDLSMGASNEIWFVLSIFNIDSVRGYWYGFRINDIPVYDTVSYRAIHFSLNSPVISNRYAYIKTYLWNPKKQRLKVVDFSLDFYPPALAGSGVEQHDSIR